MTWIATVICISGTVINIWRNNLCFYLWAVGEIIWAVFDIQQELYSRFILDFIGLILAIAGMLRNRICRRDIVFWHR